MNCHHNSVINYFFQRSSSVRVSDQGFLSWKIYSFLYSIIASTCLELHLGSRHRIPSQSDMQLLGSLSPGETGELILLRKSD